ncbi:MAG TPA: hypothetical protein VFZ63_17045 [Jiangellaceae bacterium]
MMGSVLAGFMQRRLVMSRALAIGLATIALGNLVVVAEQGRPAVLVAVTVLGLGLGLASVAANSIGTDVAEHLRATAAGILNTAAQVGTATGIAVILLIAASASYPVGWLCAAVGALAVAGVVVRTDRPTHR